MKIPKFLRPVFRFCRRNAGTLLTGASIAGLAVTSILSAKGATKVQRELQASDVLSNKDEARLYIRAYAPAAMTGLATSAAILGLNAVGKKALSAAMAGYAAVSKMYNTYREKNIEINGDDTAVMDAVRSEYLDGCPRLKVIDAFGRCDDVDFSKEKQTLFYEPITETFFWSTVPDVLEARYHLNRQFSSDGGYISFDDWLAILGIYPFVNAPLHPVEGFEFGWDCEYVYEMQGDCWVDVVLEEHTDDKGRKYFNLHYPVEPCAPCDVDNRIRAAAEARKAFAQRS